MTRHRLTPDIVCAWAAETLAEWMPAWTHPQENVPTQYRVRRQDDSTWVFEPRHDTINSDGEPPSQRFQIRVHATELNSTEQRFRTGPIDNAIINQLAEDATTWAAPINLNTNPEEARVWPSFTVWKAASWAKNAARHAVEEVLDTLGIERGQPGRTPFGDR